MCFYSPEELEATLESWNLETRKAFKNQYNTFIVYNDTNEIQKENRCAQGHQKIVTKGLRITDIGS
jgi:hypothetical protein